MDDDILEPLNDEDLNIDSVELENLEDLEEYDIEKDIENQKERKQQLEKNHSVTSSSSSSNSSGSSLSKTVAQSQPKDKNRISASSANAHQSRNADDLEDGRDLDADNNQKIESDSPNTKRKKEDQEQQNGENAKRARTEGEELESQKKPAGPILKGPSTIRPIYGNTFPRPMGYGGMYLSPFHYPTFAYGQNKYTNPLLMQARPIATPVPKPQNGNIQSSTSTSTISSTLSSRSISPPTTTRIISTSKTSPTKSDNGIRSLQDYEKSTPLPNVVRLQAPINKPTATAPAAARPPVQKPLSQTSNSKEKPKEKTELLIQELDPKTTRQTLVGLLSSVGNVLKLDIDSDARTARVVYDSQEAAALCKRKFHKSIIGNSHVVVSFPSTT